MPPVLHNMTDKLMTAPNDSAASVAFSILAPTRTLRLAVEMTEPCYDRNSLLHSRCVVHGCHRCHSGYGDTDHQDNDSMLGDEALHLLYLWDCQSSIENLCGKHGCFNVGDCRRHHVGYGCPA